MDTVRGGQVEVTKLPLLCESGRSRRERTTTDATPVQTIDTVQVESWGIEPAALAEHWPIGVIHLRLFHVI